MVNKCKKCLNRHKCTSGECHYESAFNRAVNRSMSRPLPCTTCVNKSTCVPGDCHYVDKHGRNIRNHRAATLANKQRAGQQAHIASLMDRQNGCCACCGQRLRPGLDKIGPDGRHRCGPSWWIVKDKGLRGKVFALICRSCLGKLLTLNNVRRDVREYGTAARGFDEVKVDACVLEYWKRKNK